MSASAKQYKVTVQLPEGVSAMTRTRAGIVVDRVHGYVGELTPAQLKSIKADRFLSVVADTEGATDSTDGQGNADEIRAKAEAEAAKIVETAEAQAKQLVDDATAKADKIKADATQVAEDTKKAAKDVGEQIVADAKKKAEAK